MNRFLLLSIKLFKKILLVCFCVEGLAIVGGVIFNVMNLNVKGVSVTDFRQLIIVALRTGALLLFFYYIGKKY